MNSEKVRRNKAKGLRYRKAISKYLNLQAIEEELGDIAEQCDNITYFWETDEETLLSALDGDKEDAQEFKMMFSDLSADCEQMGDDLRDTYVTEYFDDFFTAAGGSDAGGLIGYDTFERDYFGIETFTYDWAESESRKRLLRLTKEQLVDAAKQCFTIAYAYLGLYNRYQNLKAAMDILENQNKGYLEAVKNINEVYEKAEKEKFREYEDATRQYFNLLRLMPQEAWIQ